MLGERQDFQQLSRLVKFFTCSSQQRHVGAEWREHKALESIPCYPAQSLGQHSLLSCSQCLTPPGRGQRAAPATRNKHGRGNAPGTRGWHRDLRWHRGTSEGTAHNRGGTVPFISNFSVSLLLLDGIFYHPWAWDIFYADIPDRKESWDGDKSLEMRDFVWFCSWCASLWPRRTMGSQGVPPEQGEELPWAAPSPEQNPQRVWSLPPWGYPTIPGCDPTLA